MKLLSYDGPIVQFMEHVADFFILNFLTVVCSIPLVTAGAALAANCKVMQDLTLKEETPIVRAYFQAFRDNFKQVTGIWLIAMVLIALFAADYFVIYVYFDQGWGQLTAWFLGILAFLVCGVLCYAFPLICRYENTVKEHLRNSVLLALGNLPRTVVMVLLAMLPVLLALISMELFLNLVFLWLVFAISLTCYLQALLILPILRKLEEDDKDDGDEQKADA